MKLPNLLRRTLTRTDEGDPVDDRVQMFRECPDLLDMRLGRRAGHHGAEIGFALPLHLIDDAATIQARVDRGTDEPG